MIKKLIINRSKHDQLLFYRLLFTAVFFSDKLNGQIFVTE